MALKIKNAANVGTAPLRASKIRVTTPILKPKTRYILVVPGFLLPTVLISVFLNFFESKMAAFTQPIRYETTPVSTSCQI